MNDIIDSESGKILRHGQGSGPTSRADVERRARELALIDGRNETTAEDLAEAEKELQGHAVPPTSLSDGESRG